MLVQSEQEEQFKIRLPWWLYLGVGTALALATIAVVIAIKTIVSG